MLMGTSLFSCKQDDIISVAHLIIRLKFKILCKRNSNI